MAGTQNGVGLFDLHVGAENRLLPRERKSVKHLNCLIQVAEVSVV